MTKYRIFFFVASLNFLSLKLYSQFFLPFGDIPVTELSTKPYHADSGADAVVISDRGVATLNYSGEFYVEFERDTRIRIINSDGFKYANVEIPYSVGDRMLSFRASTFNIRNGEIVETKIPRKSFILEKTSESRMTLKFNFPDVHEGSVIEYSYKKRKSDNNIAALVPWSFQSDIPVILSSMTVAYPDFFKFKAEISGSAEYVNSRRTSEKNFIRGETVNVITNTYYAENVPAFRYEPIIKSSIEHITQISFELASVSRDQSYYKEVNPTYATLTKFLLDRDDFGAPLKTDFKSLAESITFDQKDNLSKVKKIHEYITKNILYNDDEDFTVSNRLRRVLSKERGNSAEINMILITMLRSLNIKADPVILSTRSNGTLNQLFVMIQQFNYVVARVSIDGVFYIIDATDPLLPFNVLPFNCLNGAGRLIAEYEPGFIDLKNKEKDYSSYKLNLSLDISGTLTGNFENTYSDYAAYEKRKLIKMVSETGYIDELKSILPTAEISEFKILNQEDKYSDFTEAFSIKIANGVQQAGDELLLNPVLPPANTKNPFYAQERKFPVDFGCPVSELYSLTLNIPEGYSVAYKPENISIILGKGDAKYEFRCTQAGNTLLIKSGLNIDKTVFQPSEYTGLQDFYLKIQQKQSEMIVLKKNSLISQN
jgi:hypothetical protein